ncbi:MAG: flavodoxin [Pseudomonadota bacterium]
MTRPDPITRRHFIAPFALLPLAAAATSLGATAAPKQSKGKRALVAYFSRSGNTRVIAGQISRSLGAVLYEIEPAQPYPEDYFQTVEQARRERDSGFKPPLKGSVSNLDDYAVVYLGLPIWGETVPPVIRSFLATHNLSGKTLIPFITHGGYGVGNSKSVLGAHAPGARLLDASLVMQADQERQTVERVTRWLDDVQLQRRPRE